MKTICAPALLWILIGTATLLGQTVPAGFQIDTLISSSSAPSPHDFCYLPNGDDRILIAGQQGTITVYTTNAPLPATATVGTITGVESGGEMGLLSIAVDPNWPTNPWIYVWYNHSGSSFMRLSRWQISGDLANPSSTNLSLVAGSEYLILSDVPDNAGNHNGGTIRFGPDGMMYLTFGEDADMCGSQDRTLHKGKLLRMTPANLPAGSGGPIAKNLLDPGDNPWSSSTNVNERLVLGYGLRNPFSFNIDDVTGDLFIADVGGGSREEIDYYPRNLPNPPAGVNYGWPWMEGIQALTTCTGTMPANLQAPLDDYSHATGGASIMAAGFVRANAAQPFPWPVSYDRNVFHNDYFNGTITRLTPSGSSWSKVAGYWGTGFVAAIRFQQDPVNGDLKFIQHSAGYSATGYSLKRIRVTAPLNQTIAVSGGGQTTHVGQPFGQPLIVRALSPTGLPLAGHPVYFTASAGIGLSTTNPVLTDAQGYAQTTATAGTLTGAQTVTANAVGADPTGSAFSLFVRGIRMTLVQGTPTDTLILAITYAPSSPPSSVNYLTLCGVPQAPLVTPFGSLCVNPFDTVQTLIIADAIGVFGFVNAQNGVGNPNLTKVYLGIPQSLAGQTFDFTYVAYEVATGTFDIGNQARVTF